MTKKVKKWFHKKSKFKKRYFVLFVLLTLTIIKLLGWYLNNDLMTQVPDDIINSAEIITADSTPFTDAEKTQ